ncbi:MAG: ABC transporter permease subunit, partial [Candidatus Omnitrophica bacterium]|nr:ABC transporter permease subunit [Candidatus Omnitrophota bacterium]
SLYRLIAGASIAIPLAVIIGMSIAMNKWCSFIFTPLIATLYPMPKLALFPLLLVIFGLGDISKIALITVGIFFWVLFYTLHGVQRLFTEDYMDIAAAFGIPLLKKVRRIVLRGALPEIINGVKTGLGHGLSMVVASEFTFSKNGIGYFIWNAWDQFRIVDMYCGLVVIGSLGIIAYYVPENIKNNLVEINRFGIND